jgi:serine/threonine protein kinase
VEVPPGQAVLQLPDGQVKFMFGCLVGALELVHNKGYTHHDLKAANFVRFYDGKFKLIDFDNARLAGRVRRAGVWGGWPACTHQLELQCRIF